MIMKLLSVAKAIMVLGISRAPFYALLKQKGLSSVKIGRIEADLRAFVASLHNGRS